MNTKVLLSALVTGVVGFLMGWIIFGMLGMMDYYTAHCTEGWNVLQKTEEEMNFIGMIIANLAWGSLMAWMLWKMGVNSAIGGLVPGAVLAVLVTITYDMFFYSTMNVYKDTMIFGVDVAVNAVMGAVVGVVAGFMLGMGGKKVA
jgi:hypothetical protein